MIDIKPLVDRFIKKLAVYNMSYDEALSILGVSGGASEEEMKAAYKKKVLEFHPDRNPDRDTTEEMKKVNRAFEVATAGPVGPNIWDVGGYAGATTIWDFINNYYYGGGDRRRGGGRSRREWCPGCGEYHYHAEEEEEEEERRRRPKDDIDRLLDDIPFAFARREPLDFGRYKLSIQAGDGFYCQPRSGGLSLSDYEAVEMAIIDTEATISEGRASRLVPLYKGRFGSGTPNEEEYPDLMNMPGIEHWESEQSVGAYVPIEIAKRIVKYFQKKQREKESLNIEVGDTVEVTFADGRNFGLGEVKDIYSDEEMGNQYVVHFPNGRRGTYFANEVELKSRKPRL